MAAAIIPVTPAMNASSLSVSECETIEPSVLSATFFIRRKEYSVYLDAEKLVWERTKSKNDRNSVLIENILAIKSQVRKSSSVSETQQNSHSSVETDTPSNIKQFTIFYAKRVENSSNPNKWRNLSQTFQNNDIQVCQLWIQTLQRQISEQVARPRRLLLFVNPYGGKKRALQIYDGIVKPIFQLAGIDATTIISQRSNQIRDFIMTQSLEHFDGIVCIGGDGTFSELFNGFIFRTLKDLGYDDITNVDEMPKINDKQLIPLGCIPAGSTDTVAYCLNGTCDVRTIALNIALGQVNGLDLSSVSNQNGRLLKFYASVMSYGFLGDVAIESEKFRWMGPSRYDYSGFKKLLLNRGYDGEVSLLVDSFANDPLKGPECLENCPVCETTDEPNQMTVIKNTTEIIDDKCNNHERVNAIDDENQPAIHIDIHVMNAKNNTKENTDQCQYVKTINGKFFMVNGANISCACPRSPNGFSKFCHLCDGYIDLILVRHTSFLNNLRFLLAMSSGRNCKITDLNHVEIYRTKKFSFKPTGIQTGASTFNLHSSRVPISNSNDTKHSSVWNCDGEVVLDSDISIRSHRRLINVYRRGMFNAQKDAVVNKSEANIPCCC
ncbi:ceramide kinase [Contarinia nasturtii]|uniref:ceramide kinase n=1 Tax=Contarinia nasturtii TaxID=265458 RepID=UPI0012D454AB|nr:ceramide kinase [Contarinia nasturtii]XP_031638719.1 ceramide kinase [Contarinia nasturtii]